MKIHLLWRMGRLCGIPTLPVRITKCGWTADKNSKIETTENPIEITCKNCKRIYIRETIK